MHHETMTRMTADRRTGVTTRQDQPNVIELQLSEYIIEVEHRPIEHDVMVTVIDDVFIVNFSVFGPEECRELATALLTVAEWMDVQEDTE
jgi:hypothetical protein